MSNLPDQLTAPQRRALHRIPQTLGSGSADPDVVEELKAMGLVEMKLGCLGLTAKGAHAKTMLGPQSS